ncbi:MAG: RNA pseudouridine synthase, partial [Clostridia bacterium]
LLFYYLNYRFNEFVCRIIGRLDKFVSGLVVVAKNAFCASYLNCHMSEIQKTYYALVSGKIDKPQRIDKNIMTICENGINVQKRICDENGKSAITNVFPIKSNNNFSIVKLLIENGRTHQIRVHLSSENRPIVGDLLYGGTTYQSDRVCLHCGQILLPMPGSDKRSVFAADMPKEFLTYANLE